MEISENVQRILHPKHRTELDQAQFVNDWCNFHARVSTQKSDLGAYYARFIDRVNSIITPPDKQKAFWNLFPAVLPSQKVVSKCQDEINKVFTANDRFIDVECVNDTLTEDFRLYLDEIVDFDDTISSIFSLAWQAPNSVAIVDLPQIQNSKYPNPYVVFVQSGNIYDIEIDSKNDISAICLASEDKKFFTWIDDTSYRIFETTNNEVRLISESLHGLDYCPAFYIWDDIVVGYDGFRRFAPILSELQELDEVVFGRVCEQSVDLYAAFPIIQFPATPCNNSDCDGGYITTKEGRIECESCKKNSLVGPGTTFEVPVQAMQSGVGTVASFINADTGLLEYYTDKVNSKELNVYESLTGGMAEPASKQAINEKQVQETNERRKNKLIYWAENLECIHSDLVETIGKLRYGFGFSQATIKYGREFYLETLLDAIEKYKNMLSANIPQYLLGEQLSVIETLFTRNNTNSEKRIAILSILEPMPTVALNNIDSLSIEFVLKENFLQYVKEFELEYGSIVSFFDVLTFKTKIDFIKTKLIEYASRDQNQRNILWKQRQQEAVSATVASKGFNRSTANG